MIIHYKWWLYACMCVCGNIDSQRTWVPHVVDLVKYHPSHFSHNLRVVGRNIHNNTHVSVSLFVLKTPRVLVPRWMCQT